QPGHGILDPVWAAVADVVPGEAEHGETRFGDRPEVLRRCAGCGNVAAEFLLPRRMRDFQVTDRQIGPRQSGGDARQPVAGVGSVENVVTGNGNVEAGALSRARDQSFTGRRAGSIRPPGLAGVAWCPPLPFPLGAMFT